MSLQNGHINSIRRYLLGDLSEEEQDRFDQLLMSDDALYEQLLFAEDDLIDEYIFGTLADEDRSKFNQRFLHVPELRQSVNFAAALRKRALQTTPQVIVEEPTPERPSLFDSLRRFFTQPVVGVAFAGLLLAVIGVNVWLIKQNSQLRSRVGQLEAQTSPGNSDLQRRFELAEKRNDELLAANNRLAEELRKAGLPQVQQEGSTPPPGKPAGTGIFAVILTSGGIRESGETKTVTFPANTTNVKFELDVAPGGYQSYSAVLQTAEDEFVWRRENLKFRKGNVVPFEVPVKVLVAGDYHIVLTGIKPSGARDEVDRFNFRIQK